LIEINGIDCALSPHFCRLRVLRVLIQPGRSAIAYTTPVGQCDKPCLAHSEPEKFPNAFHGVNRARKFGILTDIARCGAGF
jgi:hypothetical protein